MKFQDSQSQPEDSPSTDNDNPELKKISIDKQPSNGIKYTPRLKKEKIPQMIDEVLSNLNPDVLKNKSLSLCGTSEQSSTELSFDNDKPIQIGRETLFTSTLLNSALAKKNKSQKPKYSDALFNGNPKPKNIPKKTALNPFSNIRKSTKKFERPKLTVTTNSGYDPKDILKEMLVKRARMKNEPIVNTWGGLNEWYEVDENSSKNQKRKNQANGKNVWEETIWWEVNGHKKLKTSVSEDDMK
ncbi:unnamed protein product [Blepharisma stoltei]|uniref:Uncharacterized protein n=1 Tax=Blepharisma stoltei TaxID=1481888 RepID=A0AAU9IW03_9CILI|nr:unnamed protein product [Blepharisma stoltei]